MFRRVGICFILLLVGAIFLPSGCGGGEPVTCGGRERDDFCRLLAADAETVVIGQVISFDPEHQRTEPTETEEGIIFSDWDVEVERYIVNPQPFQVIQVRDFIALVFAFPDSPASPIKGPTLHQGERVLLFLDKQEPSNTHLEENQFTIGGPYSCRSQLCSGKLLVHEGKARNDASGWEGDAPWEPLDEIIAVITEM